MPDSVLIPRITTLRETVAAYKEFPVNSGGRQTLIFLIDDRAFLYHSFLFGLR